MNSYSLKALLAVLMSGSIVYFAWIIAHLINALFEELVEHMYHSAAINPPENCRSRRLLAFENAIRVHFTLSILLLLVVIALIDRFC